MPTLYSHLFVPNDVTGRARLISKTFVGKVLLRIMLKYELTVFELTMHFKYEMIRKHFTETSNKVELRINRARPVVNVKLDVSGKKRVVHFKVGDFTGLL